MKRTIASFAAAFAGIAAVVKSERNMRTHLLAAAAAVALGFLLELSKGEWLAIIFSCALVMAMETMNTAVEAVVDLISPRRHPLAKKAKDCAAGAVLLSAIAAFLTGLAVFAPKIAGLMRTVP